MQAKVSKWGNSLALRLPRHVADEVRLVEGATVELEVENGSIKVTPTWQPYRLSDLLAGEAATEADWGQPEGKEVW